MGRQRTSIIELLEQDRAYLESLVRDGSTPQRVARRARILLALSDPETVVQELAEKLEQARNTIWHLCRRYKERGIEAVFDAPRSGRPWTFSPFAAGRHRTVSLLRSLRCRPADHALVHAQFGTGSSGTRHCAAHCPLDSLTDPAPCRLTAASFAILEDADAR